MDDFTGYKWLSIKIKQSIPACREVKENESNGTHDSYQKKQDGSCRRLPLTDRLNRIARWWNGAGNSSESHYVFLQPLLRHFKKKRKKKRGNWKKFNIPLNLTFEALFTRFFLPLHGKAVAKIITVTFFGRARMSLISFVLDRLQIFHQLTCPRGNAVMG